MTSDFTLPKKYRSGRLIRGIATWKEMKIMPASLFIINGMIHSHAPAGYSSKAKRRECKDCTNPRQNGSSRCADHKLHA